MMTSFFLSFRAFFSLINKAGSIMSSFVLFLMMLLISSDVIGRYSLNRPVRGTYELSSIFTAMIVFLGLAFAQEKNRHIHIQFVLSQMPGAKWYFELIRVFIGCIFSGLLAWYCIPNAIEAWRTGESWIGELMVPYWPAKAAIGLGSAMLCIQYVVDLLSLILHERLRKTK